MAQNRGGAHDSKEELISEHSNEKCGGKSADISALELLCIKVKYSFYGIKSINPTLNVIPKRTILRHILGKCDTNVSHFLLSFFFLPSVSGSSSSQVR